MDRQASRVGARVSSEKKEHEHGFKKWMKEAGQEMFYYHTNKEVRVRNWPLGCVKFVLMTGLIIGYICGFQLLWNNSHYERSDVRGVVRMQLQRPTMNRCSPSNSTCQSNFTSLESLPYCDQYTGPKTLNKHRGEIFRSKCKYSDENDMIPDDVSGMGTFFIPTRVSTLEQRRECNVALSNCSNVWVNTEGGSDFVYYADVESFTLLLDHSFSTKGVEFSSSFDKLFGFWKTKSCQDEEDQEGLSPHEEGDNCGTVSIPCYSGKGNHCQHKDLGNRSRWPFARVTGLKDLKEAEKDERATSRRLHELDGMEIREGETRERGGVREGEAMEKGGARRTTVKVEEKGEERNTHAQSASEGEGEGERRRMGGISFPHEVTEWFDPIDQEKNGKRFPSVYQIPQGDIVSVRRLLKFAGVDLNTDLNQHGESRRSEGLILTIIIKYSNVMPMMTLFGRMPYYQYEVKGESAPQYKTIQTHVKSSGRERTIYNNHGIFINVSQEGDIGEFSIAELLVILASALFLSEFICFILDYCMICFSRYSEEFEDAKIDKSRVAFQSEWLDDKKKVKLPGERDLVKLNDRMNEWAAQMKKHEASGDTRSDWRYPGANMCGAQKISPEGEADGMGDMERTYELIARVGNPYNSWRESTAILAADLASLKHSLSSASVKDGRLMVDLDEHTGLTSGGERTKKDGKEGEPSERTRLV